jgi:hypothetical protein
MGVEQISSCKAGHPYTSENKRVVVIRGKEYTQCRACDKARAQEKRDRLRGDKPKFKKDPATLKTKCIREHDLTDEANFKWVKTPWGDQKQCRLCTKVRQGNYRERFEAIAAGLADPVPASPRQREVCKRGHRMEGENVQIRADGSGRVCRKCAVIRARDHQDKNRAAYLEYKAELRRQRLQFQSEALKKAIIRLRGEGLEFQEMLAKLRVLLTSTE